MKHRSVEQTPSEQTLKKHRTHRGLRILLRILAVLGVTLLCAVIGVYGLCWVVFCGPSEMARDKLTLSMMGTSALKWAPGVFLPQETVDAIVASNNVAVSTDVTDPSIVKIPTKEELEQQNDEWADYPEGYRIEEVGGSSYHGWMVIVRDPSRLYVATANNFTNEDAYGTKISKMYERTGAVILTNASGFPDQDGHGKGGVPLGLVYSKGKKVYGGSGSYSGFVGITEDNVLVVGSMSEQKAEELGVRDGVCFGPVLVVNGEVQSFSSAAGGLNPRTCLGQRADGSLLLLVLDGRQPGSVGASYQDVASIMASYEAVNACNLDGGSSTLLMVNGELINTCCSLYGPRNLPTYIAIAPLSDTE